MSFVGLFQVGVKCFDILAWPLIALGYPICASIQAIETNSISDTQKLITYWVSFSLILLFENAFVKLLAWLRFWPYIKLIMVCCLVAPHFGGSLYVYKHLVHPCLSMDSKFAISWFNKLKEFFYKKDKLLVEVERYVQENGPEALENLIASKSKNAKPSVIVKENADSIVKENAYSRETKINADSKVREINADSKVKVINADLKVKEISADSKVDLPKDKANVADKNVNLLGITEKKEAASTRHIGDDLDLAESRTCTPLESKEMATAAVEGNDYCSVKQVQNDTPLITPQSEKGDACFQAMGNDVACEGRKGKNQTSEVKEWTCAICQVTTTSELDLNSHFRGGRHKAACAQLKANKQTRKTKESSVPKCEPEMSTSGNATLSKNGKPKSKKQAKQEILKSTIGVEMKNSLWWCTICNVSCNSQMNMDSHLKGNKHLNRIRGLHDLGGSL